MSILKKILSTRDLLSQISNETIEIKKIYAGFDATAKSLQIGNLTPLAALKHLSKAGIKPIVLLGGATSTVGDPSGKNQTRKKLEKNDISTNINIIHSQITKLIPEALIVNNFTWLSKLSFLDFLDKIAPHIPISYLINFKTFADRLKNNDPLTTSEILYPLMQGYDFLHLFENEQCDAQLGGHDQWCNVLTGVDLIQKKLSKNTSVVAVTTPLLVDKNGNKMGKSIKGAVYLSHDLCSIYDFWNFWRNIEDSLVKTCLLRFSDFEVEYINDVVKSNINEAKIKLADYMTSWVHSKEDTNKAKNNAKIMFIDKNFDALPLITVDSNKLIDVVAALKSISNSEAKRLIKNNAIKINGSTVNDALIVLSNEIIFLAVGKKDFFKIQFISK